MTAFDARIEALGLKRVARAGWVRAGVPSPESVAAHSHGVAVLALALLPPALDRARALTFAALHDLPEVRVGDLTPHDGVAADDKRAREHAAMAALCADLPNGAALLAAFEAYEAQQCPESRFVRQLDRLDMALQAVAYARGGARGLEEFVTSALACLTEPALAAIGRACRDELRRLEGEDR